MKTNLIPSLALLGLAGILSAPAALLVYEPFAYPSGDLNGQGGALGTTGTWATIETGGGTWPVHQEGVLSGNVIHPNDGGDPIVYDGTVDNLPTLGGYTGAGPSSNQVAGTIGIDPSVTSTFQTGTTTWISYVATRAFSRNVETPNLVLGTVPGPLTGSVRGDVYGGSGFGTGGGPNRNNRTHIYPMFYNATTVNNMKGIPFNSYADDSATNVDADGRNNWVASDADGYGTPNIVIMKLEWNAETGGQDIISVASFLETDVISEANFNAQIDAKPNLSSANWAIAAKPNLDETQLAHISFMGTKYFIDEIRFGETFEDLLTDQSVPVAPFELTITPNGANYTLTWESQDGMLYNVRSSADLLGDISTWTLVQGDIPSTGTSTTWPVTSAESALFYRVEEFPPPPMTLLDVDFESGDADFTAVNHTTGTIWTLGNPASTGDGGTVDTGNDGSTNCWGTDISNPGFYATGTDTSLISPIIDLTGLAGATLSFAQAIDILAPGDTLVVNIIDDTTDTVIEAAIHTSTPDTDINAANWETVDSIAITGGEPVRIEWRFTGSNDGTYIGAYIDDVLVTAP